MKIGFDAKRAFHNTTGLGNYSRTVIEGLLKYFPEHEYFLFNPKSSNKYHFGHENVHEVKPSGIADKFFSSAWRSSWVKKDIQKLGIELYHGLSHEIPINLKKIKLSSIVTIHDLIFEKYPEQFSKVDVQIYRKKFRYACENSDKIIAISKQTKQDIIDLYKIDERKISICYQSCNPAFGEMISQEQKEILRRKFELPQEFFLYVGSIIERKNLLRVCKALAQLADLNIPLIVVGDGKAYKQKVKDFISTNSLQGQVIFLSEKENGSLLNAPLTLAGIYQMAVAMIYPSFYEGFGLPVLEALWSRLPVITSNRSCLPATGGSAALYVNPDSSEEIAAAMKEVYINIELRSKMINEGMTHAQNFTLQKCTTELMGIYKNVAL